MIQGGTEASYAPRTNELGESDGLLTILRTKSSYFFTHILKCALVNYKRIIALINLPFYGYNEVKPDRKRGVFYLCAEEYIGNRVAELCKTRDISRYRLAQLTGISQTAIANIVKNESIPSIPTLEKICEAFGISLAQFFAGDGAYQGLTGEQKEIIETWCQLDMEKRRIMMSFVRSLKDE